MIVARVQLLLACVIFGWTFVATKICLQYLKPIELLGLRFLVALPVLFALLKAKRVRMTLTHRGRDLLLGAVLFALHFLIQVTGMQSTTATNTGWIVTVSPLAIALLAHAFLGERLTRYTLAGIGVATAGILLLVSRGDFRHLGWLKSVGDWLVLTSAFTWALFTIVIRNVSREKSPLFVTFAMVLPVTGVALTAMALGSSWSRLSHLPAEAVLSLLFLGIVGTAVAHWFFQEGLARVGATEAGTYLFIEPLATTLLAVPYLGESFGRSTGVGGVMVVLGVWLAQQK